MKETVVRFTDDEARSVKWLLGERYGKRFGFGRLLRMAVYETMRKQAEVILEEEDK